MLKKKSNGEDAKIMSLEDYFKASKSLKVIDGLKVAVYGQEGVGKTYFGFTFPKPIYIVDIDGHSRQILEKYIEITKDDITDDVYIYEVPITTDDGTKDLDEILKNIQNAIKLIKQELLKSDRQGTVIIDTASELLQLTNFWLEIQPEVKKYRATGTIMRTEYHIRDRKYLDTLAPLRDLKGWNILLIGHSGNLFDGKGEPTTETYPKMHVSTKQFVDLMGELKQTGKGRTLFVTKDRYGGMKGETIENPTYEALLKFFKKHGVGK